MWCSCTAAHAIVGPATATHATFSCASVTHETVSDATVTHATVSHAPSGAGMACHDCGWLGGQLRER